MLRTCSSRQLLKLRFRANSGKLPWNSTGLSPHTCRRGYVDSHTESAVKDVARANYFDEYKQSFFMDKPNSEIGTPYTQENAGKQVTVAGWITRKTRLSHNLTFVTCSDGILELRHYNTRLNTIQLVSRRGVSDPGDKAAEMLETIPLNSAVLVSGILRAKKMDEGTGTDTNVTPAPPTFQAPEIHIEKVTCINAFPQDIIVGPNKNYGPESRHLEIRFDPTLQQTLFFRSKLQQFMRKSLAEFQEVETPILFKSTPEGAREFLVPTRSAGRAYALPQSPQQYKQILMAAGVRRYLQFAKCFRDEDFRADRQPEFTQVDLEMSWADGQGVMDRIETFIRSTYAETGHLYPQHTGPRKMAELHIPRITYEEAMSGHGSDKPDLRIRGLINRIDHLIPQSLLSTLTSLQDPVIEVWKFTGRGAYRASPSQLQKFITKFLDSPDAAIFRNNPHGSPGVFVFDTSKPLEGLSAFGFEGAEQLKDFFSKLKTVESVPIKKYEARKRKLARDMSQVEADESISVQGTSLAENNDSEGNSPGEAVTSAEGSQSETGSANPITASRANEKADKNCLRHSDVLIVQARDNSPHTGSSTMLGKLRLAIWKAALAEGLVQRAQKHHYLWVTDFPLFTKNSNNSSDPGQGGSAGISSTHHPFTAPKTPEDVDLLLTDPIKAKADHYDLVVDGVELGGGSRRIHNAEMQEFVMHEILKMSPARIADFSHLLAALRAGCPPHAGFALGFDRFVAVLLGLDSIRDVIPFPKNSRGEDSLVGSPSLMTKEQLNTYHLEIQGEKKRDARPEAGSIAGESKEAEEQNMVEGVDEKPSVN